MVPMLGRSNSFRDQLLLVSTHSRVRMHVHVLVFVLSLAYYAITQFFHSRKMKSKDHRDLVLSKYEDGQSCVKIHEDLHGSFGLSIIDRWCKLIRDADPTTLCKSMDRRRITRTELGPELGRKYMYFYLRESTRTCCTCTRPSCG